MLPSEALNKDYSESDFMAKSVGIVGDSLKSEREVPVASAFIRQEKALSELEMLIEQLEHKLRPVSTDSTRDDAKNEATPRNGSSQFVRAIDEQTDRILRNSYRIRSMIEGLEI